MRLRGVCSRVRFRTKSMSLGACVAEGASRCKRRGLRHCQCLRRPLVAGPMIEDAIVLSAGQGSRLLPVTATRPKCLIEVGGKSLLQRQLEALAAAGLKRAL